MPLNFTIIAVKMNDVLLSVGLIYFRSLFCYRNFLTLGKTFRHQQDTDS